MLIAVAMVLITSIYQKGSIFVPFISTMMQREQAKMLALSGVQVAMSQLATASEAKDEKKKDTETPPAARTMLRSGSAPAVGQEKTFLAHLLPILNQWQTFKLKKDIDGVDGQIMIAVASEDGKINLNNLYDFSKKQFRGEWKKIMQAFFIKLRKKMNISANLFEPFEKFLKERQYIVNDATELLTLDSV